MDNTAPTVNIANPAAEIVNGKILVNGTASDNVGLQTVKVYRTKIGEETVDATFNSKGYKLLQSFEGVNGYNWKLDDVDTLLVNVYCKIFSSSNPGKPKFIKLSK